MSVLKTALLAGAATFVAGSAAAQNTYDSPVTFGPYVSGGYNYLDFDEKLGGSADVSAITARGGWRFTRIFSVEGDISFGIDDGNFDFDEDEEDLDFDINEDGDLNDVIAGPGELGMDYLIGLYGRASVPLGERFDVSGRAGYAFTELDSTVETVGGDEVTFGGSDNGYALGASASYDLTRAIAVRADYTHYEFDDANAESLGLNLVFKFGG